MANPDREEAERIARELFSEQHFPDRTRAKVADALLDFAAREAERADHFLQDDPESASLTQDERRHLLAMAIQEAVEEWLHHPYERAEAERTRHKFTEGELSLAYDQIRQLERRISTLREALGEARQVIKDCCFGLGANETSERWEQAAICIAINAALRGEPNDRAR